MIYGGSRCIENLFIVFLLGTNISHFVGMHLIFTKLYKIQQICHFFFFFFTICKDYEDKFLICFDSSFMIIKNYLWGHHTITEGLLKLLSSFMLPRAQIFGHVGLGTFILQPQVKTFHESGISAWRVSLPHLSQVFDHFITLFRFFFYTCVQGEMQWLVLGSTLSAGVWSLLGFLVLFSWPFSFRF